MTWEGQLLELQKAAQTGHLNVVCREVVIIFHFLESEKQERGKGLNLFSHFLVQKDQNEKESKSTK